jgi:hypothetical protein
MPVKSNSLGIARTVTFWERSRLVTRGGTW